MGEAIGDMLPAAVGVAISPIPIIAVVLMLVSPRGRVNGPAYLLGQIVGVASAGAIVLLLAGAVGTSDEGQQAGWVSWLKLVLGAGLLFLAVKQWGGRPREGETAETPKLDGRDRRLHAGKGGRSRVRALGAQPEEPDPDHRGHGRHRRRPGSRRTRRRSRSSSSP